LFTARNLLLKICRRLALGLIYLTELPVRALTCLGDTNITGFSITDDSLVTMADGSKKPIKNVKPGDYVLSLDEKTGKIISNRVKALLDHGIKLIYEMTTKSGRAINTMAEHPYLTKISNKDKCEQLAGNVWNKEKGNDNKFDEDKGYCTRWIEVRELNEEDEIAVPELDDYSSSSDLSADSLFSESSISSNISNNSFVENTLISDCFLKAISSDQIGILFLDKDKAKYESSFVSSSCGESLFASDKNSSYFSSLNVSISLFSSSTNSLNSDSEILAKCIMLDLLLINSSNT